MRLYISVITVAMAVVAVCNVGYDPLTSVLVTALSTVAVIALDGVEAWLIRRLPERMFSPDSRVLGAGKKESRFYKKLRIGLWKDKIPELGMFTGFSKGSVADPRDGEYLCRFLLECNYGVVIHFVNSLSGFGLVFFFPKSFALPVAAVNFVLSLMPAAVLRYNIPKINSLYKRTKK